MISKVVDIYNRKMGGIDLADQHIQVYDCGRNCWLK
jgi:hypothetical protein